MSPAEKFYLLVVIATFVSFGVGVFTAERAQAASRRMYRGAVAAE